MYSQRSRTSKMKLFEKNFFSCPLLQPFTMYTKSFILDVPPYSLNIPLEPLTIFAIGSILMFDWVLDTPLTCLKKDKNCKKPVKELFLETLHLKNFWEKLYWKMIFFTVIFSKFCKKSRSSHQRCSIKKAVLNNFAVFTGKHLCRSLFLIKLQALKRL